METRKRNNQSTVRRNELIMRVSYDTMLQEFKRVLMKKGFQEDRAEAAAAIFAQNSLAGVYSHGLNRWSIWRRVFPKQKDIKKQPMFTCLQTKEYCY